MREPTIFVVIYALLILIILGSLGWWAYDTYRPRPTPLQMSSEEPERIRHSEDYIQPEPAVRGDTTSVDPALKALFPFRTTPIENGFMIGTITITLRNLLDTFSTLSYNTSRDISDLELWQEAAKQRSRHAVILDEAVKRGYKLPTGGDSHNFGQETIDSAATFLAANLQASTTSDTLESLITSRESEFLVLQAK